MPISAVTQSSFNRSPWVPLDKAPSQHVGTPTWWCDGYQRLGRIHQPFDARDARCAVAASCSLAHPRVTGTSDAFPCFGRDPLDALFRLFRLARVGNCNAQRTQTLFIR